MNPKKTLEETVDLMLSDNWEDRFKAEYYQLEYRYVALNKSLMEADLSAETAEQTMNLHYRREQLNNMRMYLLSMKTVAAAEGIEL